MIIDTETATVEELETALRLARVREQPQGLYNKFKVLRRSHVRGVPDEYLQSDEVFVLVRTDTRRRDAVMAAVAAFCNALPRDDQLAIDLRREWLGS